jgi:hypothetical protein
VARIEGLTVRTVNVTDKAVEVKPLFRQQFAAEGYPSHFQFRQKVLLLFQAIEGVDVLLFIVFVQARPRTGASLLADLLVGSLLSNIASWPMRANEQFGSLHLRPAV